MRPYIDKYVGMRLSSGDSAFGKVRYSSSGHLPTTEFKLEEGIIDTRRAERHPSYIDLPTVKDYNKVRELHSKALKTYRISTDQVVAIRDITDEIEQKELNI